jgi:hypothetical protein
VIADPPIFFDRDTMGDEPPLKKYRALFEASDPDRIASDGLGKHGLSGSDTQETSTTSNVAVSAIAMNDDSQMIAPQSDKRLTRRIADSLGDAGPSTTTMSGSATTPHTKKRTAEDMNGADNVVGDSATALESRRGSAPAPKKVKLDTGPIRPDTDEAFLKALASTKKGKKFEDSFDREFNKLKISKPDLLREDPEEEWSLLADFDNQRNIRGNFMVIVEMDIHKKGGPKLLESITRPDWQLRDNYKKFKKVWDCLFSWTRLIMIFLLRKWAPNLAR